jgi:hypothetical protein
LVKEREGVFVEGKYISFKKEKKKKNGKGKEKQNERERKAGKEKKNALRLFVTIYYLLITYTPHVLHLSIDYISHLLTHFYYNNFGMFSYLLSMYHLTIYSYFNYISLFTHFTTTICSPIFHHPFIFTGIFN